MRDRCGAKIFAIAALCALLSLLCAFSAAALAPASAGALADAEYLHASRNVDQRRAETRDFPSRTHYAPPRYELAGHYSFDRRTRTRSGELYGVDETAWSTATAVDRRFHKDAEKASREAMRHAYRAYVVQSVREVTEGGKNVFAEPDLLLNWRDALRPILPH
ncbi:hypothetical protein LJC31_01350 [Synergistaceae bacterium OttesenSCG-928-I11]|nr:hypothetical protein [Synergistaceae bacterium OttesenSCG-928-I11]